MKEPPTYQIIGTPTPPSGGVRHRGDWNLMLGDSDARIEVDGEGEWEIGGSSWSAAELRAIADFLEGK